MACDVYGLMLVKNEADIIGECIEHHLGQVDHIILTDNGSTDDTRKIAESFGEKAVSIIDQPGDSYMHEAWMTRMARRAARAGAGWAVPIDGDEFWHGVRSLKDMPDFVHVAQLAFYYDHPPTGEFTSRKSMPYRKRFTPQAHWGRIAFRPHPEIVVSDGNHNVHPVYGDRVTAHWLEMDHYPIRTFEQFERKVVNGVQALDRRSGTEQIAIHWRHWYKKYHEGKLDQVYQKMTVSNGSFDLDHPVPFI